MRVAQVALRECVRQTDKLYSYAVPSELEDQIVSGSYVNVPFGKGNKFQFAVVFEVSEIEESDKTAKLKSIESIVVPLPVLNSEQLAIIEPLRKRLLCTRGDLISIMVPSSVGHKSLPVESFARIHSREEAEAVLNEGKLRSIAHIRMIEFLLENGEVSKKTLLASSGANSNQFRTVVNKGLIEVFDKELSLDDLTEETSEVSDNFRVVHKPNDEQEKAIARISATYNKAKVFLLHGITGSGKTEVYLNSAGNVLDNGGNVIYCVPEISLTPQTVNWIRGRFGDLAAVLHSRLSPAQRLLEWEKIRQGKARIVIGPRSAVFAPIKNVKLIIIDEEHDSSYKSETFPRYNTREVAFLRAEITGSTVVLGSATPSVSSFYAASKGYYELISLNNRANPNAVLPKVVTVDMKQQYKLSDCNIISQPLKIAMTKAFADNKQAILFLNRRGYSRTLVCEDCGEPANCPSCSVGMTLHNDRRTGIRRLICHYCGYTVMSNEVTCTACMSKKFTRVGIGTQQLEDVLKTMFPNEKVLRMDQDTTMKQGAHEEILEAFRNHEASILVGTQMIAKGHDFPDVSVVGILGADLVASSSDYHSSERAFQLITQASGRAGRSDTPGTVFLQSMNPDNPLLRYAASQNYQAFYDSEIKYRNAINLPPFKATGEIVLSLPEEDMLNERVMNLDKYLRDFLSIQDKKYGFELYGPVPHAIYELRGRYRMVFVIKSINKAAMNAIFAQLMKDFDPQFYPISFDTDSGG